MIMVGKRIVPQKALSVGFKTAAETLRKIVADPKHLGAELGVVAELTAPTDPASFARTSMRYGGPNGSSTPSVLRLPTPA